TRSKRDWSSDVCSSDLCFDCGHLLTPALVFVLHVQRHRALGFSRLQYLLTWIGTHAHASNLRLAAYFCYALQLVHFPRPRYHRVSLANSIPPKKPQLTQK